MAVGTLRTGKAIVGVKAESTAGTYNAPGAADAFPAFDISYQPTGEKYQRQETNPTFGKLASIGGINTAEITFKRTFNLSGVAGTAPFLAILFGLAGCKNANDVTDHVITPAETFDAASGNPAPGYSVCVWLDGIKYAIKGAFANMVMNFRMGQPPELELTCVGAAEDAEDEAVPTPSATDATLPPKFLNAGLDFHGKTTATMPGFETFSVDMGNNVVPNIDANDPAGVINYVISDRRITAALNPSNALVASLDYLKQFNDETDGQYQGSVGFGPFGSVGNQITFLAAKAVIESVSFSDRDQISIADLGLHLAVGEGASEGDEFTMTLT